MSLALLSRFAYLLRSQWLPPQRLQEIQRTKLRRLLAHAYANVPYYRQLMDAAGVNPRNIKDTAALAQLPITTKAQLVALPVQDVIAGNIPPRHCVTLRTSGSQGMPCEVCFRRQDKTWWQLLALRGWLANGYQFGHKMLVLNDSKFAPHGRRWYEYLGLFRQYYTSVYDTVDMQMKIAAAVKPDVIRGMTSDVHLLAQALREDGPAAIAPKLVLTSAELLDNVTRRSIHETLGVPPVDFYGSIECGWIAWECPMHVGYHINADCLMVECLRDGQPVPPGESGEIVVTNLHAYAMPFIRYSVGDVGMLESTPCPCGRGLPLMQTVEGRTVDCLTLADGRRISPYQLTCTLERIPGIQRYQIVQASQAHLVVKLIPNRQFSEPVLSRVKAELAALLGHTMTIEPVLVPELPKDQSGKFRVVMTKVH